ncbi:MAG TPA: four helix bundle protein [Alphaproteobacteria bacterium]|nr:four helix bundle protein [Alphaproteobacteria bacterium]
MDKFNDLRQRTKKFALEIIKISDLLPENKKGRTIGNQIIRSGTSVGANYRSACRARSQSDFISKIGIVEEECDETGYWLELIIESDLIEKEKIIPILNECNELTAIFAASGKTAKQNKK